MGNSQATRELKASLGSFPTLQEQEHVLELGDTSMVLMPTSCRGFQCTVELALPSKSPASL